MTVADNIIGLNSMAIEKHLDEFKIGASIVQVKDGPVVTRYELSLDPGVKISAVQGIEDDLAMALKVAKVRLVCPVPGTNRIGIEIPNPTQDIVDFNELVAECAQFDGHLPAVLGVDTTGQPVMMDLTQAPHLLVAGQTGSGKSVLINSIICSLFQTKSPRELRTIMVDPKVVELSVYNDAPHMLHPVITDAQEAVKALKWAVEEMEMRYKILEGAKARNIQSYMSKTGFEMAYIVIIIDEMADLMLASGKEAETQIVKLTQKARAVGIHMILATQRPSVDVVTGLIKANVPSRIACKVGSQIDSRTIIDHKGAEDLLGRGDMLVRTSSGAEFRVHGAWVSDEVIEQTLDSLGPDIDDKFVEFDGATMAENTGMIAAALEFIKYQDYISADGLAAELNIPGSAAERLISMLAAEGILDSTPGKYRNVVK